MNATILIPLSPLSPPLFPTTNVLNRPISHCLRLSNIRLCNYNAIVLLLLLLFQSYLRRPPVRVQVNPVPSS
jgi:hypothetical protein